MANPKGILPPIPMLSDLARRDRGLLLGLVATTLLTVTVLASGLSSVEVQSSRQLSLDAARQVAELANLSMRGSVISALSLLAGVLRLLLLVSLPFSIYYFVRSANVRKRVLTQLLYLVGFTYLVLALSQTLGQSPVELTPSPPTFDPATTQSPDVVAAVTEVPKWVFVVASAAIVISLAAIAVQAYRRFLRPEQVANTAAAEARRALNALDRGDELESVIFRAYYQLCANSSDRLGVRRPRDMTPTEYERVLAKSGVPKSPLSRLTRLFEKARYGMAELGSEDEHEAVAALRQILGEEG